MKNLNSTKTKTLKIDPASPDGETIKFAAELLQSGALVAFPTETVYGIGANSTDDDAVKKLKIAKKRPADKPFTIHISNTEMINDMRCEITPLARTLIKNFWPGPLTIILNQKTEDNETRKLGFRMPKNRIAMALISESGLPLAVPSANISGEKPPTNANEVLEKFDGKIDLILDGGETEVGRESTVVDTTVFPYKILRQGAIGEEEISDIWKEAT
ncbi:MAG: L-threonylcarbamoyladenylate synthase [Omnitrophica bacterium]|nr:L-threonylcarbamoyladenylate synthase [Candidatus Omnitrophota bacterium]